MPGDLNLRCNCGAVQGIALDVSPASGSHVMCYCEDCQAFAHFLNKADEVLDGHGGSDVFQMSQGRIAITAGADRLACMRLTPKGLVRWYASCCNTPIGNTMASGALPFIGMVATCMKSIDGASPTEQLGPVLAHVFRKSAQGNASRLPRDRVAMPVVFLRVAGLLLRWKLRGDSKKSPFFNSKTGRPASSPRILSSADRAALAIKVAGGPTPPS